MVIFKKKVIIITTSIILNIISKTMILVIKSIATNLLAATISNPDSDISGLDPRLLKLSRILSFRSCRYSMSIIVTFVHFGGMWLLKLL